MINLFVMMLCTLIGLVIGVLTSYVLIGTIVGFVIGLLLCIAFHTGADVGYIADSIDGL